MKVNLSLELDDTQRNVLARVLSGKDVKRLATRDEVRVFVEEWIKGSLAEQPEAAASEPTVAATKPPHRLSASELMRIDPEDEERLKGKEPGFIMGWNRVKRRDKR